jgi:hypothetical protein
VIVHDEASADVGEDIPDYVESIAEVAAQGSVVLAIDPKREGTGVLGAGLSDQRLQRR